MRLASVPFAPKTWNGYAVFKVTWSCGARTLLTTNVIRYTKSMQIEIEKLVFGGEGIGRLDDGRPIFVSKSVPGDIVDVKIIEDKKSFCRGTIVKIIKPSSDRIKPPCQYFENCGGCNYQNISYDNQLKYKQEIFQEVLDRAKIKTKPEKIIAASNHHLFYRNSLRFFFFHNSDGKISVARQSITRPIMADRRKSVEIPIEKCLLQSEKSNLIVEKICDYINKNVENRSSFWQLKIREGKRTADVMIELITFSDDLPDEKEIVEILKKIAGVKSIYHTIAPGKSLLKLRRKLIFGSPVIYEKIGGFSFQISPESFFQTNPEGAKTLYDEIKKMADVKFGDSVLDLYCGTGTIGIYLSTLAKKVTGVEVVSQAIRDAKDNARINKIKNCEFISADVSKFLNSSVPRFDVVIVDPPRAGLPKDLIFNLKSLNFKRIIYVSCNPSTLARDLKLFEERGVIAEKIQPVDMFPQTHHIELVAKLRKANH